MTMSLKKGGGGGQGGVGLFIHKKVKMFLDNQVKNLFIIFQL